jgi:hypothetical protein
MSNHDQHHDWLALIEISGPFLAVPVLKEAFPVGLDELDGLKRKRLRQAYEEWREALELEDAQFPELHVAWIDEVLSRGLELDEDGKGDVLKRTDWCAANLQASLPEHGVTLSPDLAVVDEQRTNKPLLLIQTYAQDVDLNATLKQHGWATTPADRMVQLCRSLGCRLGLVTNGERWMLVDAPVGAVTTFASWYARIWSQEPITLQAFVHLLGIRRFFFDESEQLPALFDRSLKFQDEVTEALGEQVRRAVEVLIQTLDKADQDRNRELLHDVKEPELYEAALTVMMRLVFLLSAEERGLLLMGDERYEANYALSTLRMQLRKESEEILERRWDAWSRLLAIFRAVFGGIEHENLRLPALGGSLFDPDRFPFLEGRAKGSSWRSDAAKPLPIDNRTVLLLLEAIQQFQGRTLSYRALDVEKIGYVYEGLLERTVKRTDEVTLELDATKSAKTPWVKLAELDSARLDGAARLAELLQERSGSSASRVRNDLTKAVDDTLADRLLTACQGDTKLRDSIKPYAHMLRTDPWGYPLVYPAGAFIVTTGSERRETGTHYTPKSLTEAIVTETLTPVAYVGPAEGTPRDQWTLKSPAELLELKICDPAMGSGAFLVQACRWLSDRLVEAWSQVEATGKAVSVDGEVLDAGSAKEPLPRDSEARTVIARRLIAERCLYGVDLNPLAVELAKLSIWLVTLAKGRPFGFLDHSLRCGDSLLGIDRLDQLTQLSTNPTGQGQLRLFGQNIERAVSEAIKLRQQLRNMPIRDIRDVEAMAHLDADARRKLAVPECIADAFIGEVFASGGNGAGLENTLASLTIQAGQAIDGDRDILALMRRRSIATLAIELPAYMPARRPFHWPLEFPEIFSQGRRGFDAVIGNPPYHHGSRVSTTFGVKYLHHLLATYSKSLGKADFCTYFFRRSFELIRNDGCMGLLLTNSIVEGENLKASIIPVTEAGGTIYSAQKDLKWPGAAAVFVTYLHIIKGAYQSSRRLNGRWVDQIGARLLPESSKEPYELAANSSLCFKGSELLGNFFLSQDESILMRRKNKDLADVILPFIGGQNLTSSVAIEPDRWVIFFRDWSLDYCKETYSEALEFLESRFTENVDDAPKRKNWWQFHRHRTVIYDAMGGLQSVLIRPYTSNMCWFEFGRNDWVYSNAVIVVLSDEEAMWGVLNSSIHELHTYSYSTRMKTDIRYIPSACFGFFPLPDKSRLGVIEATAKLYSESRKNVRFSKNWNLRELYQNFHNHKINDKAVVNLRGLHIDLDRSVAKSYGWSDISLSHGFHETTQGMRFTLSESARLEVLRRLLELNHQRYQNEVAAGLHENPTQSNSPKGAKRKVALGKVTSSHEQAGFDFGLSSVHVEKAMPKPVMGNRWSEKSTDQILAWLEEHTGWFGKQAILGGSGAAADDWNAAIAELLRDEFIETHADGNRWRAKP